MSRTNLYREGDWRWFSSLWGIALQDKLNTERTLSVLDVSNSKLLLPDPNAPDVTALLIGEAAAFVAIWNAI
jgi:hypothetical protein